MTRENLLMLGASFLISVGLWLTVTPSVSENKEREIDVRLEIKGLPDTLTVVGEPLSVGVVATGSLEHLDQLDKSSVVANVDLSNAKTGTRRYLVNVPDSPRSRLTFRPRYKYVLLDVEKLATLQQPVKVEPTGVIPHDFVFDGASTQPEKVTITGPATILPSVHLARVVLDLGQVRPGTSFLLPIEVLDESNRPVQYIHLQPSEVTVTAAVSAAPASRRYPVNPNWTGSPAFGYKVTSFLLNPPQISVRGDSATLSRLTALDTEPISLEGLKSDTEFDVKVNLPLGVQSTDTAQVHVVVKVSPQSTGERRGR